MKRILLFHRLNPLSFAAAWLLKPFFTIAFWRTERLQWSWLKSFHVLDPAQEFTSDGWWLASSEAYVRWKSFAPRVPGYTGLIWNLQGLQVDLGKPWLQVLAQRYEEEYLFQKMAKSWAGKQGPDVRCYVASSAFQHWAPDLGLELPEDRVPALGLLGWVDRAWLWLAAGLQLARQSVLLFLRGTGASPRFRDLKPRYIWSGVSEIELAERDNQLDFAFLSHRGLIPPQESLYLLPTDPSAATRQWLEANGIQWARFNDHSAFQGFAERAMTWAGLVALTFRGFFSSRRRASLPVELAIALEAYPWAKIGRRLDPECFLTSVTGSWPESPYVSVMNALGARTVVWHYSANVFVSLSRPGGFADLRVIWSVINSKEVWVWHEHVRDWLKASNVLSEGQKPKIELTGPVMCGDSRLAQMGSHAARTARKIFEKDEAVRYLSVFDVPTVAREMRLRKGLGPNLYPVEMLERFFEDLTEVFQRFPRLKLILKPKRSLQDSQREYAPALWRLLNPEGAPFRSGRVILLEHNIDPYWPIAMADICVGLPFTSPVLVGLRNGRSGFFHDPLGTVSSFRPKEMDYLITRGREQLVARLEAFLRTGEGPHPPEGGEKCLGPSGDPAERFVSLLGRPISPVRLASPENIAIGPSLR
jgi:polysaccharide biosynthesis PFTS motif protein